MFDGAALRDAREAKGLSRDDLAAMAGVTRQSVWSYETGRAEPKTTICLRICEVLGVELRDLFIHEQEAFTASIAHGEVAA